MFVSGGGLDRGDDLAGDAELGKRSEFVEPVASEISNSLAKPDHSLLDHVVTVGSEEKVRLCFRLYKSAIATKEAFRGAIRAIAGKQDDLFVLHALKPAYAIDLRFHITAPEPPSQKHDPSKNT